MLPQANNYNCFEYLKVCTGIYDDVYMMQHFGVKYLRSEMFAHINALSSYFQNELKLKKGDVYTVFMPTTVQSILAFYALSQIGVIMSPVHPLMSSEYLLQTMKETGSKGLMTLDILARNHSDAINSTKLPCLMCRSSDYSKGIKRAGSKAGEALIKAIYPKIKRITYYSDVVKAKADFTPLVNNGDDIAVYLNGGGTTGKSKTIMLTCKALNELVQRVSVLDEIHIPGEEAEIIVLPIFHSFGLCLGVHMAACNSARLIPMMKFDAKLFNKLMRKNLVVGVMGIPAMFRKLMEEKHFDGPWLKNIRLMFCGGDDVSDSFLDEFNSYFEKWGAVGRLRQGYGLTETASVCCTNTNTDYVRGSIGKALEGVRVEIWDDSHKRLPAGEIGEIAVSGPTVMSGYFTEENTPDCGLYTDSDGVKWVLSGDLGYTDENGCLFFSGRKKRLVIISGYNVYLSDIEKKVNELDFIKESCAVEAHHGERSSVRLYASLRKNGNEEEYRKIIEKTCVDNFSKFYVPREIVFLDELPHTPLMKVDFMKLTQKMPCEIIEPGEENDKSSAKSNVR